MLKGVVESLDAVPENVRSFYEESKDGPEAGKFVLKVEGMVAKARLDEFRETNIRTARERDDALGKLKEFKDIDPAKWPELVALERKVQTKDLIDKDGFEKTLEDRVRAMRAEFDGQVKALTTKNGELESLAQATVSKYHRSVIDRSIFDAAIKAGIREEALPDIQLRAGMVWGLNEKEELIASSNGTVIYGKDGAKPLTVAEWLDELREKASHLFKGSSGGGAGGGAGGTGGGRITSRSQLKTPADKSAWINQNGLPAWEALPD
jgi:hypothetical protein